MAPPECNTAVVHPSYRPDIDGLRAVAVLSVLAFHATPQWLPGGFAGVDVLHPVAVVAGVDLALAIHSMAVASVHCGRVIPTQPVACIGTSGTTFYLPPTRMWELIIGRTLAYAQRFRAESFVSREWQAAAGLSSLVLTQRPQVTRGIVFAISGGCVPIPHVTESHHPGCAALYLVLPIPAPDTAGGRDAH